MLPRFRLALAAVVVAASLAGCSTLKTSVAWDEKADFARYKTWMWKDDGSIRDPTWNRRFQSVMEDELAKHGLKRVTADPDLWVVVHGRINAETRVESYSPAWGYGWGYWASPSITTVYEIPVGTIIVDLGDPKTKELVWRATAGDTIRANK